MEEAADVADGRLQNPHRDTMSVFWPAEPVPVLPPEPGITSALWTDI